MGVLLALVVAIAYANSFGGALLLDDQITIVENETIRLLSVPWAFWDHVRRPVFFLSLALNFAAGGTHPFGYHLVNLFIHLIAALALMGMVARTLSRSVPSWTDKTRAWFAFFAAALWAAHPLQTQSVTYITQRAESLMGMFFLLALYAAVRYFEGRRMIWAIGAGLAGVLSGLTKEVAVVLPLVVLLYDRVWVSPSWGEGLRRHARLYGALAVLWGMLLWLGVTVHPQEAVPSAGLGLTSVSPGQYFLTQPGVIWHYLRLTIWPYPLVFDYAWPLTSSFAQAAPALVSLTGLFAAALWALRARPAAGFLGLVFFLILAPSSSIIPLKDAAFEHRMYLPSACVILLFVGMVTMAGRRWLKAGTAIRWGQTVGWMLVGLFVIMTHARNQDYADPVRMWRDVAQKRPYNARALNNLATYLFQAGRKEEALPLYRQSLALNPDARAHTDFGQYLCEAGQTEEGITYFRRALSYDSNYVDAHLDLGAALMRAGRNGEARQEFETVIRLDPGYGAAYNNLGALLADQGQYAQAVPFYEQALAHGFVQASVYHNLGISYAMSGRPRQALTAMRAALALDPGLDAARQHIEEIEARMKEEHDVPQQ